MGGCYTPARRKWKSAGVRTVKAWIIALTAVLAPLLFASVTLGLLMDRRLGTWPWGVVIGSLIGASVGTLLVARKTLDRFETIAPRGSKEED